jgi:hypothetical protein
MSPRVHRLVLVMALAGGLLALVGSGPASAAAAAPTCLSPVAADGFEPPCNPFLSSPVWGASHRDSYEQSSSPYPGPEPGDRIRREHTVGILGIPISLNFTEPYADGGRNAWFSTVATPDGRYVYKLDWATGKVISQHGILDAVEPPGVGSVSGAYFLLDRDNHLIVARERSFDVYGDAVPGDRLSPIARLRRFTLPDSALCGPQDTVVGINMLFDGRLAFASKLGMVGTLPREPAKMTPESVVTSSINGERCATATPEDQSLDQVSNSLAADERGGIYVVTSKAMYRYDWDGVGLRRNWRAAYETGSTSSVRVGSGSGTTPTLMGTSPKDDRFVVIGDGAKLMNLALFWRDEIPSDWKGLPGKDRRLACETPVTFGDPAASQTQTEISFVVRGNAAIVANSQLNSDEALALLPAGNPRLIVTGIASGIPGIAPRGLERIDWDPKTRTCRTQWTNREVSIPTAVPALSTQSGLIYGIGSRGGLWGLEGVDFRTGESKLRIDAGPGVEDNGAYSISVLGPDGGVWGGNGAAYTIFRGPRKPLPALECIDVTPPTSRARARATRTRIVVAGPARDRACGASSQATLEAVEVSVQQRVGDRCRALSRGGRLRSPTSCDRRVWLRARLDDDRRRYVLRRQVDLPAGRYVVISRAVDRRGNREERLEVVGARVR